jgi:hypothetical protein
VGTGVSDGAQRCALCGRLAARLEGAHCSARCRELADAGYESPRHPPAALVPPSSTCEGRLLVAGPLPEPLPAACAVIGRVRSALDVRHLVRVGAPSWPALDAAIEDLRGRCERHAVEVFTFQQFAAGGLARPPRPSTTREAAP